MYRNRFGHFLAQGSTLVGLALLFLVTGAPGGGFGGGYGGFGAGGGGGMAGGRSGGSGRSSFDSPAGAAFLLTFFCLSVCVSLWWTTRDWKRDRDRQGLWEVVQFALVLEGADGHARSLDALVRNTSFASAARRRAALADIVKLVSIAPVLDGFVTRSGTLSDSLAAAKEAGRRVRAQMKHVDLTPETVNLAADGHRLEFQIKRVVLPSGSRATTDGACLLVVTVTVASPVAARIAQDQTGPPAADALQRLASQAGDRIDALYVYFAPAPDEPLSRPGALRMLAELRDL